MLRIGDKFWEPIGQDPEVFWGLCGAGNQTEGKVETHANKVVTPPFKDSFLAPVILNRYLGVELWGSTIILYLTL